MKVWKPLVFALTGLCFSVSSFAESPAGNWITLDDETGQKRAVIQISVSGDTLSGRIVKVYPRPGDNKICSKCPGKFKDKPVLGLKFAWGLKDQGNGEWTGGQILDPETGKIYRAKMTVKDDKLYVRGYLGVSMLGRTQVWVK